MNLNCPCYFDELVTNSEILRKRMRYHTLVINLACHGLDMASIKISDDTPDLSESDSDSAAIKVALSSAREIAFLVQTYREQYKITYAHQFMMYAINLSLFCMLLQDDFDISSHDFLSLTNAFSIMACRAPVGRQLFRAFKASVQLRMRDLHRELPSDLPAIMSELYAPREDLNQLDRWDHYAEGLAKADGEESSLVELKMDPVVPGLDDMLNWYEGLSIGKEIQWRWKSKKRDF